MKCKHTILAQSDFGYVAHCETCHRLQIGFGTVVLSLTAVEFTHFRQAVIRKYGLMDPNNRTNKNIFVETSANNVQLAFTGLELFHLNSLITQGEAVMPVASQGLLS